jgi:hypothetical protein
VVHLGEPRLGWGGGRGEKVDSEATENVILQSGDPAEEGELGEVEQGNGREGAPKEVDDCTWCCLMQLL